MAKQRRKQGLGMASTMMLGGLMVTAGFALTSQCISHVLISNRLDNLSQARALAEAAAEQALSNLLVDPAFGTAGGPLSRNVQIAFPQSDGWGRVAFETSQATSWHMPLSVNNLMGSMNVSGFHRQIPAKGVQIIAEGHCNGVTRRFEAVAYLPPFKYALASSGGISSAGSLTVVGVKDPQSVAGGVANIPASEILPGNIGSNRQGNNSLKLDSSQQHPTLISGDAQSHGQVSLGPATVVEGSVKQNSDAVVLPQINVEDFDPAAFNAVQNLSSSTYTSQLTATGLLRRQGNLTVTQGGLNLDNGYLYVQGDVDVWGGLSGKGALFATGNVNIHGVSSFSASNQQALLCKGHLSLDGLGQNASFFQGLMYTEGDFHANDLTLVGSFMGNKKTGQGTDMSLDQVSVVQNPQSVSFAFNNPILAPNLGISTPMPGTGATVQAVLQVDVASLYNPLTDSFDPALANQNFPVQYGLLNSQAQVTLKATSLQEFYDALAQKSPMFLNQNPDFATFLSKNQGNIDTQIQIRRDDLKQQISDLDKLYQKTRMTSLTKGQFSLDPNQFIQMSDRLRKLMWRELE